MRNEEIKIGDTYKIKLKKDGREIHYLSQATAFMIMSYDEPYYKIAVINYYTHGLGGMHTMNIGEEEIKDHQGEKINSMEESFKERPENNELDEIAFKKWFRRLSAGGDKVAASGIFLSLFDKSYIREPQCAYQLGIAVLLDKPFFILAKKGDVIPENMKKMAKGIEYFDPENKDSIGKATKKLMDRAKELKIIK